MFSHMTVGSNNLARAQRFYDALFAAAGGEAGFIDDKGRIVYRHKGAIFIVTTPLDGSPATAGNGATIGFTLDGPEQVEAWHRAGVDNDGESIEDAPGLREGSYGPLYLAYLRDPDGNKLCALHRMPA